MAAYATPEQLTARYDARVIADMISDNDTRVEVGSLSGNAILLSALDDATGQIRSAARVANRYTDSDLNTLADSQDPFLIKLCCGLAMGFLLARRRISLDQMPQDVVECNQWLSLLRLGERILATDAVGDAGTPASGQLSLQTRHTVNLLGDQQRFFPQRTRYGVY